MNITSKELCESILRIEGSENGTAFLLSPEIALTVAHTIEDDDEEVIIKKSDKEIKAKVIKRIKADTLDIAILKLNEALPGKFMSMYDIEIKENDSWITYGYPGFDLQGDKLEGDGNKVQQVFNLKEGEK